MSVRAYREPHGATVELAWERRFAHARRAADTAADMLSELAKLVHRDGHPARAGALHAQARVIRHLVRDDALNPQFNHNGRPVGRREG